MLGLVGKKIISIIIAALLFIGIIALIIAAVATYKPLHYTQDYSTDVAWVGKNFNSVTGGQYESCYYCWNIFGTTQVAPTSDTVYHGYFTISDEEAEKLINNYNWVVDLIPLPDMGNINLTSYNPYDWYICNEFKDDYFKGMGFTDVRYDKKGTIIFTSEY